MPCLGAKTEAEAANIRSILAISGFICATCCESKQSELISLHSVRSYHLKLIEEISTLKVELFKLGAEFSEYRRSHPPPRVVWPAVSNESKVSLQPSDTKHVLSVHTELSEKQRRSRNVIVTGLAPSTNKNDVDLFVDLCENNLPVKPVVVRERCRRLGHVQPGKKQPLMITLLNESSTADILKHAKLLRRTCDGVYINPDLTPAEAQAAFERRVRLRIRKTGGNENTLTSTVHASASGSTSNQVINNFHHDGDKTDVVVDHRPSTTSNDNTTTSVANSVSPSIATGNSKLSADSAIFNLVVTDFHLVFRVRAM
jgi:hypothetical protein